MHKISVIVPIYNSEKNLKRCLDSILNQTYKNLEIILINDGSTDKTGEICDHYSALDFRIDVIHKENGGVSEARNYGLEISSGDFITFVDSDDWIEEDMYEKLLNNAIKYNADISSCGFWKDKEDNIEKYDNEIITSKPIFLENEECFISFFKKKYIGKVVWNKIYKSDIISEKFNTTLSIGEDAYFLFRLIFNVNKIVHIKDKKYHYCKDQNSITNKFGEYYDFTNNDYLDLMIKDVKNRIPKYKKLVYSFAFEPYMSLFNYMVYNKLDSDYPDKFNKTIKNLEISYRYLEGDIVSKTKIFSYKLSKINKNLYVYFLKLIYMLKN